MKAMVLRAPTELVMDEVPLRSVQPTEVGIRVTHTGVCGTDLKIYNGAIAVRHPLIMGHEVVGEVMATGGKGNVHIGDTVIVDPMVYCGVCFHCRVGQTNLCPTGLILGRDADGGFAEYIVAPAANVHRLPLSIDSKSGPLIQVATTCVHAQRLAQVFPAESVVVLGLGVTGQLHLQLAKARGASPLLGISRSRFKQELAEQFGADATFATGQEAVEKVIEATAGRGTDLVIDTTGKMSALADAINMVRPGGRILLFGINTENVGNFPFYQLYFKELTILNARAAKGEDYLTSIDLVESGVLQLEPLITHTLSFAELKRGIEMLKSDQDERLKVIIEH